jgi:hypothetical protein
VEYVSATAFFKAKEIYDRLFKGKKDESTPSLIICADSIVVEFTFNNFVISLYIQRNSTIRS